MIACSSLPFSILVDSHMPSGHELHQSSVITEEKLHKCEMYDFDMLANYKKTTAGISAVCLCEV